MRVHLSPPHMCGEELRQVRQAFASNFIAPIGPHLDAFEAAFSDYLGGTNCVALSSGTAALHLSLRLLDIGHGDEVWLSSMTFAGGVFPVLYQGATPVFLDLARESWTLCPELLAEELARANRENRLPKAVISTDLYGQSCDLDALESRCRRFGIPLVTDSAESVGGSCRGRKCGTGGVMSVLSFNGNKIITTGGGGMLCTRDIRLARQARFLATQARDPAPHYQHSTFGYNYRMGNISAAIGMGQLSVLDQMVARRRSTFKAYGAAFSATDGIALMPEPDWAGSTHWLTVLTIDPDLMGKDRHNVQAALGECQIESRPLWKPMHMQPLFSDARYIGAGFDAGLFERGLCLPSGSSLTQEQLEEVVSVVLA